MSLRDERIPWDPDNWEPVIHGPVWQTNEDGTEYVLPDITLGWEVIEWCARWLKIENPMTGESGPFQFTSEQARAVLWGYAIDTDGRFLYRRFLFQRCKGHGKDPMVAALALFEAVGPCRLDYIDENGDVHGRPISDAYIQIAAVNLQQTRNTSDLFGALLTDEAREQYNFNLGQEVSYARGGLVQIHCVTSSPRALEGKRPTFMISNEAQWHVETNKGHAMYGVMTGNMAKRPLRSQCHMLIIANAPIPGQDSICERLIESYRNTMIGKGDDRDLLYDSLEAPLNVPATRKDIMDVMEVIRGDSVWLDPESVVADFFDATNPITESRRKWLNTIQSSDDAVLSNVTIDATQREGFLSPGDEIVLGFDGGRTDDSTALIAIRIHDRLAVPIRLWEKPPRSENWVVPHDEVDSAVHDTFSRYRVKAFFADVNLWEPYILQWSDDYGETLTVRASGESHIGWDMRGVRKSTMAHERLVSALLNGKLFHNGDPILKQHMGNARKRFNVHGMSFGKEARGSSRKVDAYAALMIAYEALHCHLERGRETVEKKRTGRVHFY